MIINDTSSQAQSHLQQLEQNVFEGFVCVVFFFQICWQNQ